MTLAQDPARLEALAAWMAAKLGAPSVRIEAARLLSGGAIQENWRLVCRIGDDQERHVVLRRNGVATIGSSRPLAQEFAALSAAHAAGVTVPAPLGYCDDPDVIGGPFALVAAVAGEGLGPRIVKDQRLGGDRAALGERLGRELAKIHAVSTAQPGLSFLGDPPADPVKAAVNGLRATLDRLNVARPALEWGLRWAETHPPPRRAPVLVHGDYRTGNYMVDGEGLSAILDWEFVDWGDPMADLGWFCAACWRFGRPDLEAGGVATREAFYGGYAAGGGYVDDAAVRYWEHVAHLRWAVIALEQGERHLSGRQPSLELALTAKIVPELELAVLRGVVPETWSLAHAG